MQCRAHVAQLGRLKEDFRSVNTEVLIILGDTLDCREILTAVDYLQSREAR